MTFGGALEEVIIAVGGRSLGVITHLVTRRKEEE